MRVHAWLAKHTTLSRRSAEDAVASGRVEINQVLAVIGQQVTKSDVITLDGNIVRHRTIDRQLIALNKPVGYVCSHKPETNQLSVFSLLPTLKSGKWILVGRLDINTSGLLLVTTDGTLANALAHPSSGFKREYLVRVSKTLSQDEMSTLRSGVMLDDGMAAFEKIQLHNSRFKGINTWYSVILTEGRNRIVRRLMASLDANVSRLVRVRFGPVKLDKALGLGKYQPIDCEWIDKFLRK